jgi:LysR family glycine cleavage system transcriptional activator
MRRLPPLIAIEAFTEIARTGSIKSAAAALSLSAPALSRRLAALERFVGQPLFERRHQLLVITAEGERLMSRLAPAMDALASALEQPDAGEILRLKLGAQSLFASRRLMPRLVDLRRAHPDLHIDIDTAPLPLARLGDGLDAAIMLAKGEEPALYARRIDSNRVIAIGSCARAAALRSPRDLAGETLLLHRSMPTAFEIWREAVGLPGLKPAAIDFFDSGQLVLDAAAGGLGVAFMLDSHLATAADDRLCRLFDVAAPSPYNYWFVARRAAMAKKPVRLFHDWLFAAMGEAEGA